MARVERVARVATISYVDCWAQEVREEEENVVCGCCNGDQTGFTPTGGMADECVDWRN